jgi:hypothetical protein
MCHCLIFICCSCEAGYYRTQDMPSTECSIVPTGYYPVMASSETLPTLQTKNDTLYRHKCVSDSADVDNCASSDGWRNNGNVIDSSNYHYGPVTVYLNRVIGIKHMILFVVSE